MKYIYRTLYIFLITIFVSACGVKPQYKTSIGKAKLEYYNATNNDRSDYYKEWKKAKMFKKIKKQKRKMKKNMNKAKGR
jgi:hypothetical protein